MRSLILGLLAAGGSLIGFKAIAYSELSQKPVVSLKSTTEKPDICNLSPGESVCSTTLLPRGIKLNPSTGIKYLFNLLLPQSSINNCRNLDSIIGQNLICPTWLGTLSNNDRYAQLRTKAKIASIQPPATSNTQFPTLSRSSLVVTSPHQNQSLCASITTATISCLPSSNNPIFTNPAPATTRIASPFGWRRRPYSGQLQFHQGIDYGAPLGSPVVAAGNGIVTNVVSGCVDFGNKWCGNQFGNWIEIDHGKGAIAIYGHLLNNSIAVKEGMKVWQNQEIAKVGSSGWSTGAHLDFRVKIAGKPQNPADYVK